MNDKEELHDSVEHIVRGVPVGAQIDKLLEAESKGGWWPPPNTRLGRPMSDQFWQQLLLELVTRKAKGESVPSILRALARNWQVTTQFIREFLKAAGILAAFESCTLDSDTALAVLDGATRGSGIWTAGTKTDVLGKHRFNQSINLPSKPSKPHKQEKNPPGAKIDKKSMHHKMKQKWPKKLNLRKPKFWWRNRNDN